MPEADDGINPWIEEARMLDSWNNDGELVGSLAHEFSTKGFCRVPDLVDSRGLGKLLEDAGSHRGLAHRSEEEVNYLLESPEEVRRLAIADDVRSTIHRFLLHVVAFDQLSERSPSRHLYHDDSLLDLVRAITRTPELQRFGDSLGAVNVTYMTDGDEVPWHYDHAGYVLALALAPAEVGGEFEIIPKSGEGRARIMRSIMQGQRSSVVSFPVVPGSAILFNGRCCLHRVRPVEGESQRIVLLFGYDADPESQATPESTLGRYGRTV